MARVLVVGDPHCPVMRRGYVPFLQDVEKRYKTNRTVFIGDVVDWGAISFHEKNPSLSSAKEERRRAQRQVRRLKEAFPKGDWLLGNHDVLPQRQARAAGIPEDLLKDFNELWDVAWRIHPRFGCLSIDGVDYRHGDAGRQGQFQAVHQSRQNFVSMVCGHCHSEAGVWFTANRRNRVFGMNVGCGIDYHKAEMEYGRKFDKKPMLGCGVVLEGRQAYFEPMLLPSRV